jgi:hypothetical protein
MLQCYPFYNVVISLLSCSGLPLSPPRDAGPLAHHVSQEFILTERK